MTEYPTSQEGPQPVASGGGTDDAGHGKAAVAATEAVRTHAQGPGSERGAPASASAGELPRPRTAAASPADGPAGGEPGQGGARTRD
ncbi:serine/threonine protein phosphatase, partial [Streptomyces sp. NPDC002039]